MGTHTLTNYSSSTECVVRDSRGLRTHALVYPRWWTTSYGVRSTALVVRWALSFTTAAAYLTDSSLSPLTTLE